MTAVGSPGAPAAPIILTPLVFEQRVLARAGLDSDASLSCCGPGRSTIERWAAGPTAPGARRVVILAGLAGSMRPGFPARSAYAAATVVAANGARREPPLPWTGQSAVIASAPGTLTTPQAKRSFADSSGADLVDRESAAFAEAAEKKGWRWAIVRGVSDGPDDALPADIDDWVDGKGRTRVSSVARWLIRRPARIRPLLRLRADSVAAMEAVAVVVRSMLEEAISD